LLLLSPVAAVQAFDGDRQGFALGFGAGVSPLARLRGTDAGAELTENAIGWGGSFAVGWGFTANDLIMFGNNLAGFSSSLYGDSSLQTFTGISWQHYFGPPGRAFYLTAGYGTYAYDWHGSRHYICWGDDCNPPPRLPRGGTIGALIGGGYEFARHLQVGAYVARSFPENDADFSFVHANILLQYTWY
jgi:hypothetical protein